MTSLRGTSSKKGMGLFFCFFPLFACAAISGEAEGFVHHFPVTQLSRPGKSSPKGRGASCSGTRGPTGWAIATRDERPTRLRRALAKREYFIWQQHLVGCGV